MTVALEDLLTGGDPEAQKTKATGDPGATGQAHGTIQASWKRGLPPHQVLRIPKMRPLALNAGTLPTEEPPPTLPTEEPPPTLPNLPVEVDGDLEHVMRGKRELLERLARERARMFLPKLPK